MSTYELFDASGDTGMLVCGDGVDLGFRKDADAHGRPDEHLITVSHPEDLLTHESLATAALGLLATAASHEASQAA